MKRILYTLSLIVVSQTIFAQLADVTFSVRTDRMVHIEGGIGGNCWESGTEEYTGYGGFRDDDNATVSWSSCQQCNSNGNCTYGQNINIGTRTNGAYRIDPYVDGWEDDRGSRCSWDGTSCWNPITDDCRTGPGDRGDIFFRELSFPSNSYASGINGVGAFGDGDFQVYYDIFWRYTGNVIASRIVMTCTPQIALQSNGGIRSQSVFLTAGVPYRFETTSGNDTYLRLFGPDGFTIVAQDDDSGVGQRSRVLYTAATTGWHYIETSEFLRIPLTSSANLEYVINQTPVEPTANDVEVCSGENVTLIATPSTGGTLNWFLTNTSTPAIATGASLNLGSSLTPGIYFRYVSETSSAGCESSRREVQITVKASPDAPFVADAIVCPGSSASLLANNSAGAAVSASNFNWYTSTALSPVVYTGAIYNTAILNSPPTTYTFYVAGVLDGCVGDTSSATVTFYQANIPTASNDTSICVGENLTLSASAIGSTEIRWYLNSDLSGYLQSGNSFTTPNLSNDITYYVTASYANGCESVPEAINITINPLAQAPILQDDDFCSTEDVVLNASNVTGTITWYSDAALSTSVGTGSPLNIGLQAAGVYNFFAQVNNGTCNSPIENNTIEVYTTPGAPVVTPANICAGEQATLNVSSSNTVNWYADAAQTNLLFVGTGFTTPVLNTNTTYWVTISDANCESNATTVLVTVNALPNAPIVPNETVCENESATLTASGSGGTILWYSDLALTNQIATGNSYTTPQLISNTSYYVTENNGQCESNSTMVSVTVNALAQAPILQDKVYCANEDVILNATNVNGTITWYSDAALTTSVGTGTPLNLGVQLAGTYNFFAQVNNGTCNSQTVGNTVEVNSSPASPTLAPQTICEGDQATITITSSNIVNWYADVGMTNLLFVGTSYTTPVLTSSTTYYVSNQATNGCESATNSVLVTVVPQASAPSAVNDTVCLNQAATLTATGSGGTLNWFADITLTNQVGTGSSFTTPVLSSSTSYYVAENNSFCNGNATKVEAIINQEVSISLDLITDVSCFGTNTGSINTTATGGNGVYTYAWTNGGNTDDISNLLANTYVLTVTDGIGCSANAIATVNEPSELVVALDNVQNVSCNGLLDGSIAITASGGTSGYSYAWSNGSFTIATTNDLNNVGAGIYTLTVTDANSCTQSLNATILENAPLNGNITTNNILCFGGTSSASAAITGGEMPYNYLWSNFENGTTASNLNSGVVSVLVTDDNGCTINLYDTITSPSEPLTILDSVIVHVTCFNGNDGAIYTNVSGGTAPYTISWSPNVGSGNDITNLIAGMYTITVTDANNCSESETYEVENALEIVSTMALTNPSCFGEETGIIVVGNSGGTAPYSYSWNTTPPQTGVVAINLAGDQSYTVTIEDVNGCTAQNTANLIYPAEMIVNTIPTSVSCISSANGAVTIELQNGNAPFQYELNGFLQSDSIFDNLDGGNYVVFVEDANNCAASASFTIDNVSGMEAELEGAGNDLLFVLDELYIVRGEEVSLNVNLINDVGNPIVGYNWTPIEIDSISNPTFSPVDNILVSVEVLENINGNVCSLFDSLRINVSQESKPFIPTAFSPNNDGANNYFEMNVLGAKNLNVKIYNRWGELVFSNPNQGNGPNDMNDLSLMDNTNPRGAWDGKFNGDDVPTGSYAYTLEVTYFDDTTEVISGSVTIIR